jgi:hypothetical protein
MSESKPIQETQSQKLVRLAKQDLAQRLAIPGEKINLLAVNPVTWPDSSLGVPKPGVMVTPVLTPGFQILFEALGRKYYYHTNNKEQVVLRTNRQTEENESPLPGPHFEI